MYKSFEKGNYDLTVFDSGDFGFWLRKNGKSISVSSYPLEKLGDKILKMYRYDELVKSLDTFDLIKVKLLKNGASHFTNANEQVGSFEVSIYLSEKYGGRISLVSYNSPDKGKIPWFEKDGEYEDYKLDFDVISDQGILEAFDTARSELERRREALLNEIKDIFNFIEETTLVWGYDSFHNPFQKNNLEPKPEPEPVPEPVHEPAAEPEPEPKTEEEEKPKPTGFLKTITRLFFGEW